MKSPSGNPTRRTSLRLHGFDYSSAAGYYVTICTQQRQSFLANISDDRLEFTPAGRIVHEEWSRTEVLRPDVVLDEFVVMPNHLHGILLIDLEPTAGSGASLSRIINHFKSTSARRINQLRGTVGSRVWQRGFYDRVIRNELELRRIRQYIDDNPIMWDNDPERLGSG